MFHLIVGKTWFALLFSALGTIGFAALGYSAWLDYQSMPSEPVKMGVAEAAAAAQKADIWVALSDAHWHCEMPIQPLRQHASFIAISSADNQNWVIADFNASAVACADRRQQMPVGVLGPMRPRMLERLRNNGLTLPSGALTVQHLCMYCGQGNSLTGVIVCSIMVIVSLGLFPLVLFFRHQLEKEQSGQNKTNKRLEIRLGVGGWTVFTLVMGWFGRDWSIGPGIPVLWLCLVLAGLGLIVVVFPQLIEGRSNMLESHRNDLTQ